MRNQLEPLGRRARVTQLLADAAECERKGFHFFAAINREMAAFLIPPPRVVRERAPRKVAPVASTAAPLRGPMHRRERVVRANQPALPVNQRGVA